MPSPISVRPKSRCPSRVAAIPVASTKTSSTVTTSCGTVRPRSCSIIDPSVTERLQRDWPFYVWDENTGEVRWMASWDTTPEDVDAFAADVRAAVR